MTRTRAIVFLVLSALFWGVSFPLVKAAVGKVSPVELFALRFAISLILVLPFVGRDFLKPAFALLGFLNASAFLLQFVGQKYTTATEAAIITLAILPLVAFLSFTIGERLSLRKSLAALLTLTGSFVIITRLDFSSLRFSSLRGNLLIFLATFLWAVFTVISRKIQREGGESTWNILFWTGIFALPSFALGRVRLSFYAIVVALVLAVFATVLAFYLFLEAMKVIDATTSEIIISLQLVFALIPSLIFLSERLTLSMVLGCLFTLSSVFLVAGED